MPRLLTIPVNPLLARPAAAPPSPVAPRVGIRSPRRMTRTAIRRRFVEGQQVTNATAAIGTLPAAGEDVRLILAGDYNAFHLLPAMLALAKPATIRHAIVATLGYNLRGVESIVGMIDAGELQRLDFLASLYFRRMKDSRPIHERFAAELTARNTPGRGPFRIAAVRNHCKIIGVELTDGRYVTCEMSANLRTCRNIEQAVISGGADVFAFHRVWISEQIANATE